MRSCYEVPFHDQLALIWEGVRANVVCNHTPLSATIHAAMSSQDKPSPRIFCSIQHIQYLFEVYSSRCPDFFLSHLVKVKYGVSKQKYLAVARCRDNHAIKSVSSYRAYVYLLGN